MKVTKDSKESKYSIRMSFLGVLLGAIIGFGGTIYSSNLKLEEIKRENIYNLKHEQVKKKEEVCIEMIESIYDLHKMNDNLIDADLVQFKIDAYTIMAKAKIYCSKSTVDLYDEFLQELFSKKILNGELVESRLIPEIKKDLELDI